MKTLEISYHHLAKVDDELAARLERDSWSIIPIKKKCYARNQNGMYMHRLVMEIHLGRRLESAEEIDHIDSDGLNNQLENLRMCTHKQNCWNHGKATQNCEFLGVRFESRYKKPWRAGIMFNGKFLQLGNFSASEEAAYQRDLGSIKFFGDFAKLNFPDKRQEYINKIRAGYDPIHHASKHGDVPKGIAKRSNGTFQAYIMIGKGKVKYLGSFKTQAEAIAAREEASEAWKKAKSELDHNEMGSL
jgi:hypothetical protein